MTDPAALLRDAKTILLVDWPSREVPDALAKFGLSVVSHDGPGDDEYNSYEVSGDTVTYRRVGREPDQVDLVYSYRPIDELAVITDLARRLGARAVWVQLGADDPESRDRARAIVESVGLAYIDTPILDALRAAGSV